MAARPSAVASWRSPPRPSCRATPPPARSPWPTAAPWYSTSAARGSGTRPPPTTFTPSWRPTAQTSPPAPRWASTPPTPPAARVTYANTIGGSLGLTKLGANTTLTLTGSNTYTGVTTIASGTLQLGDGASLNGSVAGNIVNSSALTIANPNAQTCSGIISGIGSLTKSGTGTLILSGTNTYAGGTTITAGLVQAGNSAAFGAANFAATAITVQNGATLDINGKANAAAFPYGLTIAGSGTSGQGALVNNGASGTAVVSNAANSQTVNITLAANATVGGTGDIYMMAPAYGASTLNLAGYTFTKTGTNTLYLSDTTVTAGTIQISGGTLSQYVAANNPVSNAGNADFSLANSAGAALSLNNYALNIGSLTGGGSIGGNVIVGNGILTIGGDNASPGPYAGTISGGTAGLMKIGTGTQILSGSNTYTGGTTVNGGSLAFATTGAIGGTGASVLVNAGGGEPRRGRSLDDVPPHRDHLGRRHCAGLRHPRREYQLQHPRLYGRQPRRRRERHLRQHLHP